MADYGRGRGGYSGFEDGGSFPVAQFYTPVSEVGQSDHNLPEGRPVELPNVLHDDDVTGNGVFDDNPNIHTDLGVFADNVSQPGYAGRENGFGPSETIDWQTGTNVAVFASGIQNNVADGGVFPTGRGADYLPQSRGMADTDFFRPGLPSASIYNSAGILRQPVPGPDTVRQAVLQNPALSGGPRYRQTSGQVRQRAIGHYAADARPGLTTAQRLMERQVLSVGKVGTMDLVARRYKAGIQTTGGATSAMGALGDMTVPDLPLWQWAAIGLGGGAVLGAIAAVVFPKKGRLPLMNHLPVLPVWQTSYRPVKAVNTFGSLGETDTIEEISSLVSNGSDDDVVDALEDMYKKDYLSSFPRGAGVRNGALYGYHGFGADPGAASLSITGATVTTTLGMWIAQRVIGAAAGYYVGKKLGPSGSYAGAVGAAATLFAGPLGLAAVAAYYGSKR